MIPKYCLKVAAATMLGPVPFSALAAHDSPCLDASSLKLPDVPLRNLEKMQVAAEIKYAIEVFFAHWEGAPNLDFETEYQNYLSSISESTSRRHFNLETLKLFAKLGNGHTKFVDRWIWKSSFEGTGLQVKHQQGQWIIYNSKRPELAPGEIVTEIDGCPIDQLYSINKKYISGSSSRSASSLFFNTSYLFPKKFIVGLDSGRQVMIDRAVSGGFWRNSSGPASLPHDVHYLRISTFSNPDAENFAIAFFSDHRDAKAVIIDLRGNNGGVTPTRLLSALLLEPYRDWNESSAMSVGLLRSYGSFATDLEKEGREQDPEFYGFVAGMRNYFSRPTLKSPGRLVMPDNPIFRGELVLLVDDGCASACEDFVMPMKQTRRAVVVGDTTFGSSGQPSFSRFENGMMFSVGAKRMSFPDGSTYEGVGIEPDYFAIPTAADLKESSDVALKKALDFISAPPL